MSGKRVLAVYAALLLGFAVVLCRLYLLALHPAYAARAAAQSTVTLQLSARRGNFYDAQGRLLTGLEERWQVVCFPGQETTTAVCLHRCRRAGAFVPQPQPCCAVFTGGKLRPRPPWADRLSYRPAVCGGAAVSAFAGLSG